MQRTKSKILSILLSLVMLLSLLPTTALAAGNYPIAVAVYNKNRELIGLSNGECLATNTAGSATPYTSGDYVARYDQSSGTLFLKNYHGVGTEGGIAALGDLKIVVESNSNFTTTKTTTEALMGIQASGKLDISGSGTLTVRATGKGNVYGIYADEGVTISAPLDVRTSTTDNDTVYGIYTKGGAISLSGGEKTINALSGSAGAAYAVYNEVQAPSTGADNGKIDIRGKLTVTLIQEDGTNYENGTNYGIYTGGSGIITLEGATANISGYFDTCIYNNKGNVVIKNSPNVTLISTMSNGKGICANWGGDLRIENSTVTVSAKGLTANVEKGELFIKDSTVDLTLDDAFYRVVETKNDAANKIDLSGSGAVTLTALGNQSSSMIGGGVTLGANTKCVKGTGYDYGSYQNYSGAYDGSSKTVLQFVHEDPAPATYTVSFDANGGTGTMADVTDVSGEYTLPANGFTAPSGKQFKAWSVGGVEKAAGDKIIVTANTTVTAVWEAIEYNVTVTGGTASVGAGTPITKATMGTTVTLTAGAAPTDKVFDKWEVVSGGITLADANSATTTFTMPASAVSVKATYKTTPGTTYNLTTQVNGGHGTISASKTGLTAGSTETITFTPDAGYKIDTVTVNGTATSVSGNTLNVTMNENKTVVVTYKAIEYNITVTDGKATIGAGSEISKAAEGTAVTLTANAAPSGKVFDKWVVVSGGITLADANSATTTFTMPASAVSVKATYKTTPGTTYNLTTQVNGGHGTISASKTGLTAGSTETITFTPDAGYKIDTVTVNGTATSVSGNTLNVTMNENKTVVVTYKAIEYNITFEGNGGTPSASNMTTVGKKLSSLPTATRSGSYSFDGWYTAASGGTQITTAYTFSADTTVYAHWTYIGGGGGGGSYTPSYTVSVDKTENGTITVSPKSASKGDAVTITVKPDKGYELEMLKVLDKDGDALKLTEKNGKYSFKMPAGKAEVKATFIKEAEISPFDDVSTNAYYYEAVKWAQEKGITGGIGNKLFGPNEPCTRAQIVTFLWRAAGSPAPKNTGTAFGDVKLGSFYEQAVAWAVENGITGGTGEGMFSPNATCTRAQSVTFLYRASGSPAVSDKAEFSGVSTTAFYADAVAWAAKKGITTGIGGGLFGSGNDCTRGQIVTFLWRCKK